MISRTLMAASTRPLILAIVSQGEDYGYSIIQKVKKCSGGSIVWSDGMLYPVLQRMEMDKLIASSWVSQDGGRPRHYFHITDVGRDALNAEIASWRIIWQALQQFSQAALAGN
jgi:PadR family transcriptional regulator, regulatory protein PadR